MPNERVNDILSWAAVYYPGRLTMPPDLRGLSYRDVLELFANCPSRRAHLALVDQPIIRRAFANPQCRTAAKEAWKRYVIG